MRRPLLLLTLVLIASAWLAACLSGSADSPGAAPPAPAGLLEESRPTATPIPELRIALDEGAGTNPLGQALVQDLTGAGYTTVQVEPGRPADLYVGYNPPADFHTWPLTSTRFVPVVHFWLPITEVAYADLERIFRGEVGDWAELGSPRAEPVVPLALRADPPPPLQPSSTVPLPDVDALVGALGQAPGGIALIPLEEVDVRVRALQVDGRDPLLEEEIVPGDPLVRPLFLAWSPTTADPVVERVSAFAQRQRVAPPEPAIEIAVVGDVVPGRTVGRILAESGDYVSPFARVWPSLDRADLTIANLEGVLSDEIVPPSDPYTFLFVASGRFCEGLRYAGIDGISLANNHSMNFGAAGLDDTLTLLQEADIVAFGAGMNLEEARRPALFEVGGVTFAFLGYDAISADMYGAGESWAGTAPADPAIIAADVAAAREMADVVIPYFHWGWEYTDRPSPWQRQLAYRAVEAGADVVLGSHPHWVQGMERYRGVAILYSLGNFVFDQMWSIETRRGVIARLVFRGDRLVNLRLQAVQIEDYYQPRLLPAVQAEEVYRQIESACPEWPDEVEGAEP